MKALNSADILRNIEKLKGVRVGVFGDVGVDEYVMGEVHRISPEAPVPVVEVVQEDRRLGLAANVAQNVVSLGGKAHLLSVVGQDQGGQHLESLLQKVGVAVDQLLMDPMRPTTRKLRVMVQNHHVVRVDYEKKEWLSQAMQNEVLNAFPAFIDQSDVLVIQDYGKGVVTQHLAQSLIQLAHQRGKLILVDPHRSTPLEFFRGADLFKPNRDEALAIAGLSEGGAQALVGWVEKAHQYLLHALKARHIVITEGKEGMTLSQDGKVVRIPTFARQVFDVTGAGDTVIAALALGSAADLSMVDSCVLANFAAGVVVGKVGCVPCTTAELIQYVQQSLSAKA